MFATLTEKLIVAALALIAVVGSVMWLEHRGAERCEAGDKTVAAAAAVKNAKVEAAGTTAEAKEDTHRENALARPADPVPVISVQPAAHPACRSAAAAAGTAPGAGQPGADVPTAGEGAGLRAAGEAEEPLWVAPVNEYRQHVMQLAHAADVEVADRDRLLVIRDAVCRGKGPPEP